jgi:ubiquinone/menaquinone biosynthesis C-methylase UbiE
MQVTQFIYDTLLSYDRVSDYSIIHIPHPQVTQALSELKRVLRPGGLLLLTFHSRRAYILERKPKGEESQKL